MTDSGRKYFLPFFITQETPPDEIPTGRAGMNGQQHTKLYSIWYAVLMRIQSLNHSTYQHQYHIVWGTKYRRKYLKPYVRDELVRLLYKLTEKYPTLYFHAINTDDDHIHIQIEIPPNHSVAAVVQRIKIETSKHLKKKFKFIDRIYIDGSIWSVGYFSSTIGLNEARIKQYIEWQGKQDVPHQPSFGFS